MATYRVYWLDSRHRIKHGDWIEADDDEDAMRKAQHLCEDGVASVELWQGGRPIQEIECHPAA